MLRLSWSHRCATVLRPSGRLADLAPGLLARGVTSLRIFGSAGRDAMTEDSDVDILVEFRSACWGFRVPRSSGRTWRGRLVAVSTW
jgi:hypothetical protein